MTLERPSLAWTPGFTHDGNDGRWEGDHTHGITHECVGMGHRRPARAIEHIRYEDVFAFVVRCTRCGRTRRLSGELAPLLTVEPDNP